MSTGSIFEKYGFSDDVVGVPLIYWWVCELVFQWGRIGVEESRLDVYTWPVSADTVGGWLISRGDDQD